MNSRRSISSIDRAARPPAVFMTPRKSEIRRLSVSPVLGLGLDGSQGELARNLRLSHFRWRRRGSLLDTSGERHGQENPSHQHTKEHLSGMGKDQRQL